MTDEYEVYVEWCVAGENRSSSAKKKTALSSLVPPDTANEIASDEKPAWYTTRPKATSYSINTNWLQKSDIPCLLLDIYS